MLLFSAHTHLLWAGDFLPIAPLFCRFVYLTYFAYVSVVTLFHCSQSVAVYLNVFDNTNTTNTSFSVSNSVLSCLIRFACR